MKRTLFIILTIGILFAAFYFIVHKGNSRMTIWYNHGLWLTKKTKDIIIIKYPDFLVLTDDYSKSNCTMTKNDFQDLINNLDWCDNCYGIGDYFPIPDSLKNRYPFNAEFESPIGDFLIIKARELNNEKIDVYLYTDWN